MKKILLLFLSVIMVSWVFAQSLELFYEGEPIIPMSEITISAHPDSGLMVIDTLDVKNLSNTTIDVLCVREVIEEVEGTVNVFCWGSQCYPPNIDTSGAATTIGPQAVSYEFSGEYSPYGIAGTTKVKYTFYLVDNPDDNVTVIVNYDASETNSVATNKKEFTLSKAYPNPANNNVSVNYNLEGMNGAHISFYNLLGSKVKDIMLTESFGTLTINTSDFIEGIYFYSLLINNEATQTQKLIIKH